MYWKMPIDLSRPLVRSEGNLDPIDGYVTYKLLATAAAGYGQQGVLEEEIGWFRKIVDTKWRGYSSSDPLDLGMTLWTLHWVRDEEWAKHMLARAETGLASLVEHGYFERSVTTRLAFREFGDVSGSAVCWC